jgi:hypothetical protein
MTETMMKVILLLITILTAPILLLGALIQPLDYRVPARIPDAAQLLPPADIQLAGWASVSGSTPPTGS